MFKKYQKELLSFINTEQGNSFISQIGGRVDKYPIVKITPHSIIQHLGGKSYKATIFSGTQYQKLFGEVLTMVDIANSNNYRVKEKNKLQFVIPHFLGDTHKLSGILPKIYLNQSVFNPDGATSAISGLVDRDTVDEAWATIIAGAGTAHDTASSNEQFIYVGSSATSNQFNLVARGIILFNSSALTSNSVISSGTFSLWLVSKDGTASFNPNLALTSSTPASNTALANSDYGQVGSTRYVTTDMNWTSSTTGAYNDMTLNATGLAAISQTGITKFGTKSNYDIDASAPTWASTVFNALNFNNTTGANPPKLTVNFTLVGGNKGYSFII